MMKISGKKIVKPILDRSKPLFGELVHDDDENFDYRCNDRLKTSEDDYYQKQVLDDAYGLSPVANRRIVKRQLREMRRKTKDMAIKRNFNQLYVSADVVKKLTPAATKVLSFCSTPEKVYKQMLVNAHNGNPLTATRLVSELGLAKGTVSKAITELIDCGIFASIGTGKGRVLYINPDVVTNGTFTELADVKALPMFNALR